MMADPFVNAQASFVLSSIAEVSTIEASSSLEAHVLLSIEEVSLMAAAEASLSEAPPSSSPM
jgi:hypothetical protein